MILTLDLKDSMVKTVLVMIHVLIAVIAVIAAIIVTDVVTSVIFGDASYGDSALVDVDALTVAGSGKSTIKM